MASADLVGDHVDFDFVVLQDVDLDLVDWNNMTLEQVVHPSADSGKFPKHFFEIQVFTNFGQRQNG
jgi:hypothetical protein